MGILGEEKRKREAEERKGGEIKEEEAEGVREVGGARRGRGGEV